MNDGANSGNPADDFFGEVISRYTRAQAIADGVLVDLSRAAPDVCGQHYRHGIACTAAVWSLIQRAIHNRHWCNDLNGIVHDILYMSKAHALALDSSTRLFRVIIKGTGRQSLYSFKLVCGPGDNGEPVLTLMFPEED